MNAQTIKAIAVRAIKTFIQAFIAVFLTGLTININQVSLKALIVAAFSAGLSALSNVIVTPPETK